MSKGKDMQLVRTLSRLREELDVLRQQDNRILFDLGNPPAMDSERGRILQQMRVIVGKMQAIERLLDR